MNTTTRKPRAFAPDPDAPGQTCEAMGCAQQGEYRAPKSRSGAREFHWFCLEHVREFNASWDYYKGMSADEIEMRATGRYLLAAAELAARATRPYQPDGRGPGE